MVSLFLPRLLSRMAYHNAEVSCKRGPMLSTFDLTTSEKRLHNRIVAKGIWTIVATSRTTDMQLLQPMLCAANILPYDASIDDRTVAHAIWGNATAFDLTKPMFSTGKVASLRARVYHGVESEHCRLHAFTSHLREPRFSTKLVSASCASIDNRIVSDCIGANACLLHPVAPTLRSHNIVASCASIYDSRIRRNICMNTTLQHALEPFLCSIDIRLLRECGNDCVISHARYLRTGCFHMLE
mmetsp:Transcript_112863/g.176354  ORF Transcript_112863/g.176354 Transcript_112863/m.176354 type:complete len:241 (-) Transcript_112863:1508-2230(-)